MTRKFDGHESHRRRSEYNEDRTEIGEQMPCKLEEMWK